MGDLEQLKRENKNLRERINMQNTSSGKPITRPSVEVRNEVPLHYVQKSISSLEKPKVSITDNVRQ